ncbi:MAG: 3-phosphoglycerate dehydrogenase family protein [Ignavibacteriaceae bacterium]|jgi:D-3-phosphoglycerate dehydrogenase
MKVLVADKFPEKYLTQMKALGLEVDYTPQLIENNLHEAVADVDILVVRSTKVNAAAIEKANLLNLIIRAGAGVNNIDISAANKKGIYVANCPGMNSIAVAELAMGLILSLDRRIPDNVMDFKNGIWNKGEYSKAEGLFGKNLALIGVGNIGKEVAKRAHAFGMNVYGKDIFRIESDIIKEFTEMDKILPICDIISIHLPLTPQTKGLFNKEMFGYLHPNTFLINTSRAEIIDEEAMLEAIKEKNIRVAVDVFKGEPEQKSGAVSSPLQQSKNIYITHHIGASTEQAQNAVADETVRIIKDFLKSGVVAHWVNKAKTVEMGYQLVVKHYDKPGVLSSIFSVITEEGVNIEEIENINFDGGLIASCTMKFKTGISAARLQKIQENPNVLSVSYIAL